MTLVSFWFGIIAVLWCGFLVLEGFDFGVGMLHSVVGRNDAGRRLAIHTIAPTWDGNEVWLVVAAAGMFAAFPGWYATAFSAFYLLMLVLLVALIMRGISIEFRSRGLSESWRQTWDVLLTIGSAVIPFGIGVFFGGLLGGLPIDSSQEFTGSFTDLLQPYALYVGATLLLLCALHGGTFLALRSTGDVRERALALTARLGPVAAGVTLGFVIWTRVQASSGVFAAVMEVLAVVTVLAAVWAGLRHREAIAFAATSLTLVAAMLALFGSLYPRVMVSSTNSAYDLTIHNTASGSYALKVMTVVVAVLFPVVLGYQVWTYRVFRHRLIGEPATAGSGSAGPESPGGPEGTPMPAPAG